MSEHKSVPRTVWVLGIVSLCMDASSELIHSVLPVYLTTILGLSVSAVGIIEGMAQATGSMMKLASGAVSDRLGRRKAVAVFGYGLSALSKPLFPIADGALLLVAARLVDRIGKGIRGAPRDAIIADVTVRDHRDASYALREALDTVGAVVGPLMAVAFFTMTSVGLRAVLWVAVVPAFMAVMLLAFAVKEPRPQTAARDAHGLHQRRSARSWWPARQSFTPAYPALIALSGFIAVARLSEAFLVLSGQQWRLPLSLIPLVMALMSATYAASSYAGGRLHGQRWREARIVMGLAALAGAYALLGFWHHPLGLWLGTALYGIHMGLTQAALSAAVADATMRPSAGATAFGIFHFTTGTCQLAGASLAGWLWTAHGSPAAFTLGLCGCAMAAAAAWRWAWMTRRATPTPNAGRR